MSIVYFAHNAPAHTHVETSTGETTIFWVVIVGAVLLGLIAAAVLRFMASRKIQPQEQESKKKDR